MESENPAARRRLPGWLAPTAAVTVVAVLAVTLLLVQEQDERPRAEVGASFDLPFQEDPLPTRGEVLLPWARLDVGVGDLREELPDLLGARANLRAPEGGSFLRVEAVLDSKADLPFAVIDAPFASTTEVVLRADGRDYPLSGPGGLVLDPNGPLGQGGGRWVAVDGAPTDLELRFTVNGLTQVFDASDGSVDAGRAAEIGDLPTRTELAAAKAIDCGKARRVDESALRYDYPERLECAVQLTLRTPYVDGLGWAKDGREFVVVQVSRSRVLSLRSADRSEFWRGEAEFTATLDGAETVAGPVDVNELNRGGLALQDPDNPQQVVFDVPQGEPLGDLVLGLDTRAELGGPFVTEEQLVQVRWTVPGRKLA